MIGGRCERKSCFAYATNKKNKCKALETIVTEHCPFYKNIDDVKYNTLDEACKLYEETHGGNENDSEICESQETNS